MMCKMDKKRWSHRKMNAEFREEEESPSRHAWRLRFAFDRATNLWKIMETNFSALRSIAGTIPPPPPIKASTNHSFLSFFFSKLR